MEWYNSLTDNQRYLVIGGGVALIVGIIVLIVVLASPHLPKCLKDGGDYAEVGGSDANLSPYPNAWAGSANVQAAYPDCTDPTKACPVYGLSPGNNGEACVTW